MTALDFSFTHPTIAQLKAAGVTCVIRYLTGTGGKALTKAELESYLAAGISVVFVLEDQANDCAGGEAAGVQKATEANAALNALGVDLATSVVYFAVDENVVQPAVPYFQGIHTMRPADQTGLYGPGALCTLLLQDGLVAYTCQSESKAFSGNATTLPTTDMQQEFNGAPIGGTDLDLLLKDDVGQWPRPAPAGVPSPPELPTPAPPSAPYPVPNQEGLMVIDFSTDTGTDGTAYAVLDIPAGCTHIVACSADVLNSTAETPAAHDGDLGPNATGKSGVVAQPAVDGLPAGKAAVRLAGGIPGHGYTGHAIFA